MNANTNCRGNTALHMCVYHNQLDMYDHLIEFCGASEHVRNNRGQTPMLLAASLGRVQIFQVQYYQDEIFLDHIFCLTELSFLSHVSYRSLICNCNLQK